MILQEIKYARHPDLILCKYKAMVESKIKFLVEMFGCTNWFL